MTDKDDWTLEGTELGIADKWYNKTSYVQNEYDDDIYHSCAFPYKHPNGYPVPDGVSVCRYLR